MTLASHGLHSHHAKLIVKLCVFLFLLPVSVIDRFAKKKKKYFYILEPNALSYKEKDVTYLEKESKINYCNFIILLLLLLVI